MNDKLTYKTVTAAEIHVILFIADAPVRTLFVGSLSQSAVLVPHDTRTRTHTHTHRFSDHFPSILNRTWACQTFRTDLRCGGFTK